MRRFLPVLAILSVFYFLFSISVRGQTPYSQALSDYQFTAGKYQEAHDAYTLARNRFLKSPTLANKQAAFEATRQMLGLRRQTLDTYFVALLARLGEVNPPTEVSNTVFDQTSSERNFLSQNQAELEQKATLEEVLEISKKLENRKLALEKASYRTLAWTLIQKEENRTGAAATLLQRAEALVERIEKEGEDVSLLRGWTQQTRQALDLAKAAQNQASGGISQFEREREAKGVYREIKSILDKSSQAHKKVLSYLKEVLREIKNE